MKTSAEKHFTNNLYFQEYHSADDDRIAQFNICIYLLLRNNKPFE